LAQARAAMLAIAALLFHTLKMTDIGESIM
jgi:hypothetical protein